MNERPFDLTSVAGALEDLARERAWGEVHRPSMLISSLVVEATELLDLTLWLSAGEVDERVVFGDESAAFSDEVADVAINLILLAQAANLDLATAVADKVKVLRARFAGAPDGATSADTRACRRCGHQVRSSWSHCPGCGSPAERRR